jgi:hypothetical protein
MDNIVLAAPMTLREDYFSILMERDQISPGDTTIAISLYRGIR